MSLQLFRWCALAPITALLLSGCALRPQLHSIAIDHNRLVADSANELTLLNILRARDRQPMHFTSMNVLRGSAQASLHASLGADVRRTLETISPTIEAGVVSNPSFDIAIYDKQEFQKGIMRPVEPSLYQYFLINGWPHDYLARLLVERIEFRATGDEGGSAGALVGEFDNDPQNSEKADEFDRFLAQYDISIRSSRAAPQPIATASDMFARSTLSEFAALSHGPIYLELAGEHAGKLMRQGGIEYAAELIETDASAASPYLCEDTGRLQRQRGQTVSSSATFGQQASRSISPSPIACTFNGVPVGPPLIMLRSPDAVMYFLGEYLRGDNFHDEAMLLKVWRESDGATGPADRQPVVSTRFMGERYTIYEEPDDAMGQPTGRSMQTLAFVQQLINLHKSAEELPASTSLLVQQ